MGFLKHQQYSFPEHCFLDITLLFQRWDMLGVALFPLTVANEGLAQNL